MKKIQPVLLLLAAIVLTMPGFADSGYKILKKIKIGGEGGWDYVTIDSAHGLIFLPRSSHTMVLKADSGKVVADIPGQKRNHGVALVPPAGRGFITDGSDGSVFIFDLKTYAVLGKTMTEPGADGIVYDPASDKVLVVCGDGGTLYSISPAVNPKTGKAEAKVDLGGKPEFFTADGNGRIYINLVDKDQIVVLDSKALKVVARWSTAPGGEPTGIAIDPMKRRLFIGCRKPQKLVVMDANDGKVLAALPIGAGNDAVVADRGTAFASCRDGSLSIVQETAPDKFAVVQTVATEFGARTSGVDTQTHLLYLPVAEFGPMPKATKEKPHPRPRVVPGTFAVLVIGQ